MNKIFVILMIIYRFGHCVKETDENLDIWFRDYEKDFVKQTNDFDFEDFVYKINFNDVSSNPLLLSAYIERNDTETARRLSLVERKDIFLNITSYSGFITVDKVHNSNLWFWYFPHDDNTKNTPFVIWLQGGPGDPSFNGLFEELGPFKIVENDTDVYLEKNPHSWHIQNSLLFVDNSVGTGFSFTDNDDGYPTNHIAIAEQLYIFIIQFLQIFPDLQNAPLYIAGESHAAKFIPYIAKLIHKNNPTAEIKVNLKGLVIANGVIDPEFFLGYSDYYYNLGFVDEDQAAEMKYLEDKARIAIKENDSLKTACYWHALVNRFVDHSHFSHFFNYVYEETITSKVRYENFLTISEIRKALHVGNVKYSFGLKVLWKLINDIVKRNEIWLEKSLEHYKVLLFSGQMNMIIPYPMAVKSYRNLRWSKSEEYLNANRKPWYEGERVIGYTKSAGNLLEVFFRNAGYMIGKDQPKRLNTLINSFIRDIPLEAKPENK